MGREVDRMIGSAFQNGRNIGVGNTTVTNEGNTTKVYLHGNLICKKTNGVTCFTLAGHDTNVTRNRLRGLGVELERKGNATFYKGDIIKENKWYQVLNKC